MTKNEKEARKIFRIGPYLGVFGWGILLSAFGVGVVLVAYDLLSGHSSPYTGVLTYLLVPVFIGTGLALVAGSWILRVFAKAQGEETVTPAFTLDLNDPKHIRNLKLLGLSGLVFACISAIGGYNSYHYTESTEFCGVVCHKVMQPEFTTYQNSPHARVSCVECHIGAGANWYVKSKMSGLRQVHAYMTETYELPIETPVMNLRPARDTCEQCHWPEKFSGNLERTYTYYMRDDENTPYSVRMLLKVGGGSGEEATGIHWHISSGHKIEYISSDPQRKVIPWVRMTDRDGEMTVYTSEDLDPEILEANPEIRTMDCIDCHNRPSHIFNDPDDLVNQAMVDGKIEVGLRAVKDTAMGLMEEKYESTEAALQTIEQALRDTYIDGDDPADATRVESVNRTIGALQQIYSQNFFPEMGVDWTTHPNFIGHRRWDGCYRCHDGQHTSEDGKVVSHDCDNCHLIIGQGEGHDAVADMPYALSEFVHPQDMGPLDEDAKCTDCHEAPDATEYLELASR